MRVSRRGGLTDAARHGFLAIRSSSTAAEKMAEVGEQDPPVGRRKVLLLERAAPCLYVGWANAAKPSVPEEGVDMDAKARLGGLAGGFVEGLGGQPIAGVPTEADPSCLRVDVRPSKLVRFHRDQEGFGGALVSVREGFRPLAAIGIGVANAVAKTPPT